MPHTIEFDAAKKRITIVVTAPVSEHDALECFRKIRSHPEFSAEYGILINSLAGDRPPTAAEALNIGGVLKVFFAKQKIAWVRNGSNLNQWTDAIEVIANLTLEVRNFSDLSTAEAWLAS